MNISDSFEKCKVAVEKLKLQLSAYDIPRPLSRDPPAKHFKNDDNITQVFVTLCLDYKSWFNTNRIKVIVEGKLGCEDDRQMLAEYEEKTLLPYLQRSIFEIPSTWTGTFRCEIFVRSFT